MTAVRLFEELGRLPPGRHGIDPDEVARQQRLRLMAAMLDAVARYGYGPTAVSDVLAAAGVSRRTFYEHFADKEECFLRAFDHVIAVMRDAIGERMKATGSGRAVGELVLQTIAANPEIAWSCLVGVLALPGGWMIREEAIEPLLVNYRAMGLLHRVCRLLTEGTPELLPAPLEDVEAAG